MSRTKLAVVRQLCVVSSFLFVTGLANAGNGQSESASEEGAEEMTEDVAACASSVPVPLPALPNCAGTIPRYAACEIELTSARPEGYYHNPFTNIYVQAQFTNGSQT
jgi:hypothetical protein